MSRAKAEWWEDALLFQVEEIPEEGLEFDKDLPREWLDNIPEFSRDEDTHIEGLIRVSGLLTREGANLRLKGRVSADLVTICSRCGEFMHYPLSGEFDLLFLKGAPPRLPEELELTEEDFRSLYYNGVEIDLAPYFKEEVALEVPMQALCRPDCRGLCPHCGANLNLEVCNCKEDEGDPRLAALRNLKLDK